VKVSGCLFANDVDAENAAKPEYELVPYSERAVGDNASTETVLDRAAVAAGGSERDCPTAVKLLLSLYFALCVGAEMGYSGWISTLALSSGVTSSHAASSYLVSVFYGAFTTGRCVSVVLSVYVANTYMLRAQFLVCLLGCALAMSLDSVSYEWAAASTAVMGLGISTLFPLGLSIVQDYGFSMDSRSTTLCILGATVGEVTLPLLVGRVMAVMGAAVMPTAIFVIILGIITLYADIHRRLLG
jgi:fucose permease